MSTQQIGLTEMAFAIYDVKEAEVKTPMGPRTVRILTKSGEHKNKVPSAIVPQLQEIKEFNTEMLVEGRGQVIAETQNGLTPIPVAFLFHKDVTTFEEAFKRFDEHMEEEMNRRQQAQQQNASQIIKADAGALQLTENVKVKRAIHR